MTAQTATPCPHWCRVGADHESGDRYHFGEYDWTTAFGLCVEINHDGAPVLAINPGCEPLYIDLAELDAFIARLTAKRSFLAELSGGAR